jgi:hypothetical protein
MCTELLRHCPCQDRTAHAITGAIQTSSLDVFKYTPRSSGFFYIPKVFYDFFSTVFSSIDQ